MCLYRQNMCFKYEQSFYCYYLNFQNNQITNKQYDRLHQWYTNNNRGAWHEDGVNRRKRNILYEEAYRTPVLEPEPLDTVVETIQERPWGVLSFNGMLDVKNGTFCASIHFIFNIT